jgi:hypothetical protein
MTRPPGVPESFDVRTVVYLRRGANPPELGEEESTALHHAHLAHLAHLAELGRRGIVAANGPLRDQSDTRWGNRSATRTSEPRLRAVHTRFSRG